MKASSRNSQGPRYQQHRKTRLRTPASAPVKVTYADGSTEIKTADAFRPNTPAKPTDLHEYALRRNWEIERQIRRQWLREVGLSYEQYLLSEHWRSTCLALARTRHPYTCVCCGGIPAHVHHRTYVNLGNEHLKELDLMCDPCHRLAHKALDTHIEGITLWNVSRRLQRLKSAGFGTDRGYHQPKRRRRHHRKYRESTTRQQGAA